MAAVSVKLNPLGFIIVAVAVVCVVLYATGLPRFLRSEETISMKELLSVSIDLAQKGGVRVREIRDSDAMHEKVKGKTLQGAKEFVTDADLQSHRAIVYGYAKAFPRLNVISEEHETKPIDFSAIPDPKKSLPEVEALNLGDQRVAMSDIVVWIDPLDATQEYTENLRQYVTTMACVAVRGRPVIGVIHKPFEKETAWAWVGYGHSKNLIPADKDKSPERLDYKIIVSRSHAGEVESVAKEALGKNTQIIPAGGSGYKVLEVIKGNADAYVHVTRIKKWDICAGNAIIMAVQGHLTTLEGRTIDYSNGNPLNDNGVLATLKNKDTFLTKFKPLMESMKNPTTQAKTA